MQTVVLAAGGTFIAVTADGTVTEARQSSNRHRAAENMSEDLLNRHIQDYGLVSPERTKNLVWYFFKKTNAYTITYNDGEEEEDVHIAHLLPAPSYPTQVPNTLKGLTLRTTNPRFPNDGDIILTPMELRHLLVYQQHLPDQKVWSTTAEAGFPLEEENEEIINKRDDWEGKKTTPFLHPAISNMAQYLNGKENLGQRLTRIQRVVTQLDNEWMNPGNDPHNVK